MSAGSPKASSAISEASSSSACICDIFIYADYPMLSPEMTVYVQNIGTCDLTIESAYTDDPLILVVPLGGSYPLPLGPGEIQIFALSADFIGTLDGATFYVETDHCGVYSFTLGTTTPPPEP